MFWNDNYYELESKVRLSDHITFSRVFLGQQKKRRMEDKRNMFIWNKIHDRKRGYYEKKEEKDPGRDLFFVDTVGDYGHCIRDICQ